MALPSLSSSPVPFSADNRLLWSPSKDQGVNLGIGKALNDGGQHRFAAAFGSLPIMRTRIRIGRIRIQIHKQQNEMEQYRERGLVMSESELECQREGYQNWHSRDWISFSERGLALTQSVLELVKSELGISKKNRQFLEMAVSESTLACENQNPALPESEISIQDS